MHFCFPSDFLPERGDQVSARGTWKCANEHPDRPSSHINRHPNAKQACGGTSRKRTSPESVHATPCLPHHMFQPKESVPTGPIWKHLSGQAAHSQCASALLVATDHPSLLPSETRKRPAMSLECSATEGSTVPCARRVAKPAFLSDKSSFTYRTKYSQVSLPLPMKWENRLQVGQSEFRWKKAEIVGQVCLLLPWGAQRR